MLLSPSSAGKWSLRRLLALLFVTACLEVLGVRAAFALPGDDNQWHITTGPCCGFNTLPAGQVWHGSPTSAAKALEAYCNSGAVPGVACGSGANCPGPGGSTCHYVCTTTFTAFPNGTWQCDGTGGAIALRIGPASIDVRVNPSGKPVCPSAGSQIVAQVSSGLAIGSNICGVDGCAYNVSSPVRSVFSTAGFVPTQVVTASGMSCGQTQQGATNSNPGTPNGSGCQAAGSNVVCQDPDTGCGEFNGDYVCTGHVPPNKCVAYASGGTACNVGSPDLPRDSGGTPVPPDMTVQNGPSTVNYYSSTTINNNSTGGGTAAPPVVSGTGGSAVGSPGSGTAGGSGGDGSGDDPAGEPGEGLTCDPETDADCSEAGAAAPADDPRTGWSCWASGDGLSGAVASCFQSASRSAWTTISEGSELIQVAQATAASFPSGGSCPSASVTLLDESFDFWEVPCTFLGQVDSLLGPLFLLCWSFMGLRILLTIPGGE